MMGSMRSIGFWDRFYLKMSNNYDNMSECAYGAETIDFTRKSWISKLSDSYFKTIKFGKIINVCYADAVNFYFYLLHQLPTTAELEHF